MLLTQHAEISNEIIIKKSKLNKEGLLEQTEKKGGALVWIIVAVIVVIVAVIIWFFVARSGSSDTTATTTKTEAKAPAAGWQAYESSKYGYTINHPTTYVPSTTGDMSVKFSQDGKVVADIYASTGGTSADMSATVALYTDATKAYMTNGVATSVTVAGTQGKMISGTFGKNGGLTPGSHENTTGSVVIFTQGDRTYVLESFDAGDATLMTNFNSMYAEMSF